MGGLHIAQLSIDIEDFPTLKREVLTLTSQNVGSIVNDENHGTNWTDPIGIAEQFNIYNSHGEYNNCQSGGVSLENKSFPEPKKFPRLAKFTEAFPHIVNMRINVFYANSGLSQHKETVILRQKNGKLGLKVRFHLPILTNPRSTVFLDGNHYHMKEGILYYFNNGSVHASQNDGSKPRVHIVFDAVLTKEVGDQLFSKFSPIKPVGSSPVDPNAPIDGPFTWDGTEPIEWFEVD